ncbi:MAG: polyphosphate:AMP phosphotransferase [Acidobacteriota bacterium]
MFETAELGREISKAEFEGLVPEIRARLLTAQRALRATSHSVILIISGVEGAGKSGVVNRLHEWLDVRGIETTAFWNESDEENERPRYWRFWRRLPPRGAIGMFFGSWYTKPIVDRAFAKKSDATFEREMQRIVSLEQMLVQDGAVVLKFWFHLPKREQARRLKEKEKRSRKNWAFIPDAADFAKRYDRFARISERAIRSTDTAAAPWHIIEASDARYRDLTAGQILADVLENLGSSDTEHAATNAARESSGDSPAPSVMATIDLDSSVDRAEYDERMPRLQAKLGGLTWKAWNEKRSTVIIFEGSDAAGKGGAIRRLIAPIDARLFRTISVAAPTADERARHYLWRFWRNLPRAGTITIYDRSWYGRVLVERVEGFATDAEWRRAYREINEFEEQLVGHGVILVKFWLHIDPDEQLRRFREREQIEWKKHKITDEDWRNREKGQAYESAIHDMIAHTSTDIAPWHLVPARDKRWARLEVVQTVVKVLKQALK